MKWIGYGLQGVGGLMALTGMGVFALGKLVERAASSEVPDGTEIASVIEVETIEAAP